MLFGIVETLNWDFVFMSLPDLCCHVLFCGLSALRMITTLLCLLHLEMKLYY